MVDVAPRPSPGPEPEEPSGAIGRPRRRRPILVVAIVVAVLAGFLVAVFATSRTGGGDTAATPLLGQPAPAIQGQVLGDGGLFDLATRRGSWVVLNFFASWCEPCKQEAPELARFAAAQQAQGAAGAELVGIVYNDTRTNVTDFLSRYGGGNYPVVVDGENGVAIDYGVVRIPETWIIDPDGIVRARVISTVSAESLDRVLREAQGVQP